MGEEHRFSASLEHLNGLEFKASFDWQSAGELRMDEPAPLGQQSGPNASRLIAAAVGNCLTASLLFCLQRSKVELEGACTEVVGHLVRNEKNRLRIGDIKVRIQLPVDSADRSRLDRCLGLFEDYCVVTESVRNGIPVEVEVVDQAGRTLLAADPE